MFRKKNRRRNIKRTHPVSLVTLVDETSPISERYRTIRANIQFATTAGKRMKIIVVTSPGANEGKSTTAANLAVVFAKSGQKTLLVGADMHKPTVYKTFNLHNEIGLSTVLSTQQSVAQVAQKSVVPNLFILPSGPKPPNLSELLGSVQMNQVLEEARNLYDIVLFDMPPVTATTDARIMASKADGTILVVRENISDKESLVTSQHLLQVAKAHVLGVVYNGAVIPEGQEAYDYYSD